MGIVKTLVTLVDLFFAVGLAKEMKPIKKTSLKVSYAASIITFGTNIMLIWM